LVVHCLRCFQRPSPWRRVAQPKTGGKKHLTGSQIRKRKMNTIRLVNSENIFATDKWKKRKKLVIGWIDPSNRFRPYPILKFRFSSSSSNSDSHNSNRRLVFYYKSERENLLFALLTSARVSVDRAPRTYAVYI
jgi:hypothetical protein